MAGRTDQALVLPCQGKARRSIMIEIPDLPAVDRMAAGASRGRPERPRMMIVRVAGFACHALGRKTLVFMTSSAGKRHMLAQEREAGQRVIEGHLFLPADRIVATRAIGSEPALVNIVIGMAAYAGYRKLHNARRLFVAGGADKRLVRAAKRKPCHRVVIEAVLLPVAAIVAARAIGAVAALVDIVLHMAGNAGPRRFPDCVADAVA